MPNSVPRQLAQTFGKPYPYPHHSRKNLPHFQRKLIRLFHRRYSEAVSLTSQLVPCLEYAYSDPCCFNPFVWKPYSRASDSKPASELIHPSKLL